MTAIAQRLVGWTRRHLVAVIVVVLFLAVGYLSLVRLDNTLFWDDEAYVALFARNFLATGQFTGWDGRNLVAFRNGWLLNQNLNSINPPLQYVAAAVSFRLLGQTTWAGRFPFVLAGLASLAMFAVIVHRDFRDRPTLWLYAVAVLGLSVVFLLNIRQCRYYALGLLFALVSYDAYRRCLKTGRLAWYLLFTAAVVALFYSNYLLCGGWVVALGIVHLLFHRRQLKTTELWKVGLVIVATLVATVPYIVAQQLWSRTEIRAGEPWLKRKALLLWWNFRELDTLGLPWMLAVLLVFLAIRYGRRDPRLRQYLEYACLALGYTLVVALVSPQPVIGATTADTRYLIPAVPCLAVLVAVALYLAHRWHPLLAAGLGILVVTTNACSARPWGWRFRWLLPAYVNEIHHDYPTAYGRVVDFLEQHAQQDELVLAAPEYTNYPLMFYLGDKVRFCCLLNRRTALPVDELEAAGAPLLAEKHYPDWLVLFGLAPGNQSVLAFASRTHREGEQLVRMYYAPVATLDVYWEETSRPELHLHTFGPRRDFDRQTEAVYILRGKRVPVRRQWSP